MKTWVRSAGDSRASAQATLWEDVGMITLVYGLALLSAMPFHHILFNAPPTALAQTALSSASESVRAEVSFPNRAHHEAEVEITFPNAGTEPLHVQMSRSSPGRYRLHDFARNVYSFRALDSQGRTLAWTQPDPHSWLVDGHDGTVTVRYTVFADHISGTYSAIDSTHAKINPPSVFAWAHGFGDRPIELTIASGNPKWRVATQLHETSRDHVFTAPDLQYFMDSPIEVSDFSLHEWTTGDPEDPVRFRMAFHHLGSAQDEEEYVAVTRRIVDETAAVFGEFPKFETGRYTFMADYLPWATGDAMEHRNSTPLSDSRSLEAAAEDHLETLVHEFFHAWNVERLRPQSLEPFDFGRINLTHELWFAEGLTNYYDGLLLARSGAWSVDRFLASFGQALDRIIRSPASNFGGPREMSAHAGFRDRGSWRDPQNAHNTYLHYYIYGDAIGAALDLSLRKDHGTSLDALMAALWQSHGRTEIPYTETDLEKALADLTNTEFAQDFFDRFVRGSEVPNYAELVAGLGLDLRPQNPGAPWIGSAQFDFDSGGARIATGTWIGSPLYDAGLDRGDVIISLDGKPVSSKELWQRALEQLTVGATIQLDVLTRVGRTSVALTVREDPTLEVGPDPRATETAIARRNLWLRSQVKGR